MSALQHAAPPAYQVDENGRIRPNEAGQALLVQHRAVKAQIEVLNRSWCNATLAVLFVHHPWVEALTLRISSSWEYDDSGGCYRSGSCRVQALDIAPGMKLPEEILQDGYVDQALAAEMLTDMLNDDSGDLALLLLEEDESEDRTLSFKRAEVLESVVIQVTPLGMQSS